MVCVIYTSLYVVKNRVSRVLLNSFLALIRLFANRYNAILDISGQYPSHQLSSRCFRDSRNHIVTGAEGLEKAGINCELSMSGLIVRGDNR